MRKLRGVVAAVISDDSAAEEHLLPLLEGEGCAVRRPASGFALDCVVDVGIVAARRQCGWAIGAITALRCDDLACAVVCLMASGGPNEVARSLRAGAVDCLLGPSSDDELIQVVSRAVDCTHRWRRRVECPTVGPAAVQAGHRSTRVEAIPAEDQIEGLVRRLASERRLTARERQVLYWLLGGYRYDDIAVALGVAPRTAKFHASNLLRKLELDSRYELPRLLAEVGG